jgi:glutamate-1-semialdehyde aminotransferase/spore coat polysaccharide biosynthesis protein SpsF (cytidylyltransferase family)
LEPEHNVVAIIQARMNSTRLPGKVLANIAGQPMLWQVVNRVRRASTLRQVVVATSTAAADDAVAAFCRAHEIECYRGSESDVLDRYYQAAKSLGAEIVVRITGDCPLIDAAMIDDVVRVFLAERCDYASNTLRATYPDGLDTEVFSFAALEKTWREARLGAEREHVTPYLRNSGCFRVSSVEYRGKNAVGGLRWTVDEPCDLAFVRAFYEHFDGRGYFGFHDILQSLNEEPTMAKLNSAGARNEGYYKSFLNEPAVPAQTRDLSRSYQLKAKAERLIPGCSQTFSKAPSQFVQSVAPVFLARGSGSHVWDVDDNEYIDYPMALGPVILGHNFPAVTEAMTRQVQDGCTFSLPHPLEVEVAEMLVGIIPCAEMVRFGKNGSDVTAAAVRVARAYTGRELIACCGYHGWQDWYIGTTTRRRGVPRAVQELTLTFEYNNSESLARLFAQYPGQIAAVIMEPIGVQDPLPGFLRQVAALTRSDGALLVFDEMVTGFRVALGGAQEHFGITPDLACFGKAIANGFPLSAVVGRRDVMALFNEIFFSFTFGGEAVSLAAAKATIEVMRERDVIAHLWEQGQRLKDGYQVLAREYGLEKRTECQGLPPHTVALFRDEAGQESLLLKSLFMQECLKRGVLFSGVQNICFSHSPADIDTTLRVYRSAMEILARAVAAGNVRESLEGEPVEPVFRRP